MNSLKVLSAAAALALVLPMTTPSFAQGPGGGGRGGGGGGGAAMGGGGGGGGGASIGGGGGGRMGGGGPAMGGGSFGGGARMGGGAAIQRGGGNFAAGPAMRPGIGTSPSFTGGVNRHIAGGGSWQGRGGNWQHRHHHYRRGGFWPGFAAGAAIGGLGSYAYYGSGYGYYDDPYYYGYYDEPSVAVVQDGGGDAAYCARRFKSYDPASGTYLGYDGKRHPCP